MNQENNDSKICSICGRPTHKESKYCIFHASAEEKTEDEFKKALREHVDKIKKEDGDYDFEKFIFVEDIYFNEDFNITVFKNADFSEATFEGITGFSEATFKGDANFSEVAFKGITGFNEATFKGDADFGNAAFEDYAIFRKATFERSASFWGATFERSADFREVAFEGSAFFWEATFKGDANLNDATFKGDADFYKATFEGDANLSDATFKGDADFREVAFKGDADFRLKYFVKILNFSKIKTFAGKKLSIQINNEKGKISLNRAYLENTSLNIELVKGTLIDFSDVLLRNTIIQGKAIENHILQEKEKRFSEAQEIYLLLKNNFHSIGRYEDESWAFKKEKDMERKSNYHFKTLHKWLWSCFLNAIYGYGERPWNVVIAAGVVILFSALLFSLIGIGNPEIIELKGIAVHQNSGNIFDLASKGLLKNNVTRNFPDSLYFSAITFTTLGYGDFRPLEGWGRILAGSEAFIGAFMMALFVYTFARRTGGR